MIRKRIIAVLMISAIVGYYQPGFPAKAQTSPKMKHFIHVGGGIPVNQEGSGFGSYRQLNQTHINNIKNSPFDGFGIMLNSFGCDDLANYEYPADFTNQMNLAKSSGKNFWPRLTLLDMYKCQPDQVWKLWDQGSVDYAMHFYKTALQVSKETGVPGIVFDPEAYGQQSHSNDRITFLAQQNGKTIEEVIQRLKDIGTLYADEAQKIYGAQDLTVWFVATDPWYTLEDGYKRASSYVFEAMLDRIIAKNYPITVIEGGEWTMNYVHTSLDELKTQISSQATKMKPFTDKYGSHLVLGGTSILWLDYKSVGAFYQNILSKYSDEQIEVKAVNDLEPLMEEMFNRYEYVWVYRGGAAPQEYDEYAPLISEKFRPMLRSALCGNGICEASRSETSVSCAMDCEMPPISKSDLNQDSQVNVTDLGILMSDFGKSATSAKNSRSDINADGTVNVSDLGIIMSEWGS